MTYKSFLIECFKEFEQKQEKFIEEYNMNSFSKWFYDQASGILTFSSENEELNFRYHEVGTFSKISNTWKWSWDNEHTLEKVKERLEKVRMLGEHRGFEKLTTGLFESSEEEGWEFSSIASKILNGIGAYKTDSEDNFIFMVIYDVLENTQAKEEKAKFVDCGYHDRRRRAFVCQHLTKEKHIGFEEAFESYEGMEFEFEDDDFQAWCNECEKIRSKHDGWDDESMAFAGIKLVCEKCYFEMKAAK